MNKVLEVALNRRFDFTGGKPFVHNGLVYWIEDDNIYMIPNEIGRIEGQPGIKIGEVVDGERVYSESERPSISSDSSSQRMVRINLYVSAGIRDWLVEESNRRGTSMSDIAREAIQKLIDTSV